MRKLEIDELDIRILLELLKDGRASFRRVAERVGVSVATVASRVEAMEKRGVIRGYTALVDPMKLGYQITAVIQIRISSGNILEVQRRIAEDPRVFGVYDVTGEADSIVLARFRSRGELSRFIKKILAMEEVERTVTHVVLEVVKEDPRPHLLEEGADKLFMVGSTEAQPG